MGEHAAEQQPDRGTTSGDRAEDPERLGSVRGSLEGHGQQAQRRRGEQRAERALQRSGGDEHPERLRQSADRRGDGEPAQTRDQRPLATEQVAELAAQEQEAPEGEGVGGDDPLAVVGREVKGLLCRRQRDVNDRRVEHDHQLRHAQEGENGPAAGLCVVGGGGGADAHTILPLLVMNTIPRIILEAVMNL